MVLVASWFAGDARASAGDPDPNYGGFGQTLLPLVPGNDTVVRSYLGFDQKLILVGKRRVSGDDDILLVRLDADGTIDEGFGGGGAVVTDVANSDDVAEGAALDLAGFLVVGGWVQTAGNPNGVVLRYGGAGSLDAGFGTGGIASIDVGGADDRVRAVAVRPDRRIVAVGHSAGALLLVQLDDFGALDPTFGVGGTATPDPTGGADRAWAATLLPDGRLVVAGEANGDVLVGRFSTAGTPDASFGTGGFVIRDVGGTDVGRDVRVRADGAVFVAGTTTAGSGGDGFVLALDANGNSLAGFGASGLSLSSLAGNDGFVGLDLDRSGRAVASGWLMGPGDEDVLLARFTSAGTLDSTFGSVGIATRDFGGGNDRAVGLGLDRADRLVLGASAGNGADVDPGAVRTLGAPLPEGEEFQVNTYTTDAQLDPHVAVDGSGRFVVVWSSYGGFETDAMDFGIHAQRYEANGEPNAPAFQVNGLTTGYQDAPAVAADAAGNFVVVWQSDVSPGNDGSGTSVLARRFGADGIALGPEFQVNSYTTGDQLYPRVASNAAGDFVVVWESAGSSGSDSSLSSVQGRFFAANGVPFNATDLQLNEVTTLQQRSPVVAMSGGDVVVVWDGDASGGSDTSPSSVAMRRFSSAGVPASGELQVNTYTTGVQAYPSVAVGGDGRFIVTWHGDGVGDTALTGFGAFAQRFASNGAPVGGELSLNDQIGGEQVFATPAFDTDESFVVSWHGAGPGDGFGVFARHFDAAGVPEAPSFRVNRDVADAQRLPVIGQGVAGDFVVVWETYGYGDSDRSAGAVAAARFDGQTVFTTTSTIPGGSTSTSTSLPGATTTTSLPGGTTTSTSMPSGTTSSTSTSTSTTTLPGGSTTSTTVPGGSTTTSTIPGGTTTSTTVAGSTTTSTTVLGSTTTSTTLPGDPGHPLFGKKLVVKTVPGKPERTVVKMISKDPGISLGAGNGSSDDPVENGGALRVAFTNGFDATFALPAGAWKYVKKSGQNRGYKAKGVSPLGVVVLKPGKVMKTVAKGSELAIDLETEPSSMEVVVSVGGYRQCVRFVGTQRFVAGRKLVSTTSTPPTACLP